MNHSAPRALFYAVYARGDRKKNKLEKITTCGKGGKSKTGHDHGDRFGADHFDQNHSKREVKDGTA